jgi:hypothetical protein
MSAIQKYIKYHLNVEFIRDFTSLTMKSMLGY